MTLWDKVQELYGELDQLNPKQREFISNVIEHGDPKNLYEELTERQVQWIHWLYTKFLYGIDKPEW